MYIALVIITLGDGIASPCKCDTSISFLTVSIFNFRKYLVFLIKLSASALLFYWYLKLQGIDLAAKLIALDRVALKGFVRWRCAFKVSV